MTAHLPKLSLALLAVLVATAGACSPGIGGGSSRPNIILVITDDQTLGTVSRETMPNTWQWLWQGGRTYPNFSISDPLCCPSRMTVMTGRYAHNTGVIDNLSSKISFHPDMRSTVQCYLKDAGYRTAFFGKFLNGWDFHRRPAVPRPVRDHARRAPLRAAVPARTTAPSSPADGTTRTSPATPRTSCRPRPGTGRGS